MNSITNITLLIIIIVIIFGSTTNISLLIIIGKIIVSVMVNISVITFSSLFQPSPSSTPPFSFSLLSSSLRPTCKSSYLGSCVRGNKHLFFLLSTYPCLSVSVFSMTFRQSCPLQMIITTTIISTTTTITLLILIITKSVAPTPSPSSSLSSAASHLSLTYCQKSSTLPSLAAAPPPPSCCSSTL